MRCTNAKAKTKRKRKRKHKTKHSWKLRGGKPFRPWRRWGRQQSGLSGSNAADRGRIGVAVTAAEVVVADAAVADVVASGVTVAVDARTADVFACAPVRAAATATAVTAGTAAATTLNATRLLAVDKKTHFARLRGVGLFARGVRVHIQRFGPLGLADRRRHDLLAEVPLPEYDLLERRLMLRHDGRRRGVLLGVTSAAAAAAVRFVRGRWQRVVPTPSRLMRLFHRRLSRPAA